MSIDSQLFWRLSFYCFPSDALHDTAPLNALIQRGISFSNQDMISRLPSVDEIVLQFCYARAVCICPELRCEYKEARDLFFRILLASFTRNSGEWASVPKWV